MSHGEIKGTGFLLRVITAQEADAIVRILLSTGEKISCFAKAGLKSRKRFGGALEPLIHVSFRARQKENKELYFLEETQIRTEFSNLRKDLTRLTAATYIAELTDVAAHEGLENPDIYNLVGAGWKALDSGLHVDNVVRQFELKFLAILGWLPNFNSCVRCGKQNLHLSLEPDTGQVTCEDCGLAAIKVTPDMQRTIMHFLSQSILSPQKLDQESGKVFDRVSEKISAITGPLFQSHLGSQRLKSLSFLRSLRGFQK